MARPSRSRPTRDARQGRLRPEPDRRRSRAAASKLRGRRRKALALRRLYPDAGPRDLARLGRPVDADLVFRSLAYAIEPEWTRGHSFTVAYELVGEGGGAWRVEVDDGRVRVERGLGESPDCDRPDPLLGLAAAARGELTPSDAMRLGYTEVEGRIFPVTRLGRWIDRAEGIDGPELDARGAPAAPAGGERRQLGQQGELQRRVGRRRRPGRVQARPGAA